MQVMVKDNLLKVQRRIAAVCAKTNRDPSSITIVGVTKNRSLAQMQELLHCGISEIGESRVQEALLKHNLIPNTQYPIPIKWHFIGHLQVNKVKAAVKIFDLIQSVDSLRLAREIDKQAARINKIQDILLQVKTSTEAAKSGLKPDETVEVARATTVLKNIRLQGLMTIAPLVDDPEKTRPYFKRLRDLLVSINLEPNPVESAYGGYGGTQSPILSMGMSDDFEIAIEEGANMIRLGRAIFEV